jgi:hypothetical protein
VLAAIFNVSRCTESIPFLRILSEGMAGYAGRYAGHGPPVTVICGRLITAVLLDLSMRI